MAWFWVRAAAILPLAALAGAASPQGAARFDASGKMLFPADYRQWVFVTSGHGMSYNPVANADPEAPFDNVFADPASYAAFLETGTWPEGTVLALEVRRGRSKGSINVAGAFQSGAPMGVEVHTKDSARFGKAQDGWAFFGFDPAKPEPAGKIPETAQCYGCHREHGAVDRTFTQFYPTLLPVAQAKGTLSSAYLKEEGARAAPAP